MAREPDQTFRFIGAPKPPRRAFLLGALSFGDSEMARGKQKGFTFSWRVSIEPMSAEQWQEVQDIITRLAVRAYIADNAEVLGSESLQVSGPSAAAAAVAGAPLANADGPESGSMEQIESPPARASRTR